MPRPSTLPRSKHVTDTTSPTRVLIVDDNVDGARSLARYLEIKGFEVTVRHDGHSGIEAARASRPDFALLDFVLPGMDGLEVARQLREDLGLSGCTLIGVSGFGPEDIRESDATRFDHFLVKPVDYAELLRLLNQPPAGEP